MEFDSQKSLETSSDERGRARMSEEEEEKDERTTKTPTQTPRRGNELTSDLVARRVQLLRVREEKTPGVRVQPRASEEETSERKRLARVLTMQRTRGRRDDTRQTTMAGLKIDEEKGCSLHECSKCKERKPETEFARSQLRNKGPGKQKCSKCASEADAIANPKGEDVKKLLEEAREAVEDCRSRRTRRIS